MNRILRNTFSLCLLSNISLNAWAFNPVDGNYAGLFVGVSGSPTTSFTLPQEISYTTSLTNSLGQPLVHFGFQSGTIAHSVLGAVGGELGYRFCTNYRVEVEAFYNNNHFKNLTLNNFTLNGALIPANNTYNNQSITFNNVENSADAHIQGDTNTGAMMINAFYDFFIPNQDGYSVVVPFVGLGIGYGYVQNALQFYRMQINSGETNDSREIFEVWQKRSTLAGQAIAGLNYFMDDFTWLALDVRYWATKSDDPSSQYTIITPTQLFTFNSTTNLFGANTKLYSINLSFNGVFNAA